MHVSTAQLKGLSPERFPIHLHTLNTCRCRPSAAERSTNERPTIRETLWERPLRFGFDQAQFSVVSAASMSCQTDTLIELL
jgi:hypothetical protein